MRQYVVAAADPDLNNLAGSLYVVATPIGNLNDLTQRAEMVLKSVQIVAAEDTRRSRVLLEHIGHRAPELVSLHEHNEREFAPRLVERLAQGDDVALISDAGTPLISDPGYSLVSMAFARGIRCIPVPGVSALTAALSVCPIPCTPFRFVGFLPSRKSAKREYLKAQVSQPEALVFLEAPHRVKETLATLADLTTRRVMIARELTKKFESIVVGTASDLMTSLSEPRGEFVCILEAVTRPMAAYDERQVLSTLLDELSPTQAARIAAKICGRKKSEMYRLAMELAETR